MSRTLSIAAPAVVLLVVLLAVEATLVLRLNEGHFSYTLDDPYIHLAMAENIARGHYGVNAAEVSAPSSSMLWPFLLAPLARTPAGHLLPLVLNGLAALATVLVFARVMDVAMPASETRGGTAAVQLLVALLVVGTNLVGMVFNGMEHTAQLLGASAIVLGLVQTARGKEAPRWLPVAIVGAVLVRFENLALAVPALAFLLVRGHRRAALGTALGLVVSLGAFTLWLESMGLGALPSSVVAKSNPIATGGRLRALAGNVSVGLTTRQGGILGIAWLLLVVDAIARRRPTGDRLLAAVAASALALHFLVGRFGWYNRYEIYIWGATLLSLAYLHRAWLLRASQRRFGVLVPALGIGVAAFPYIHALYTLPVAASNIFEQHYQMHRFATDFWRGPVAVNDLGWVAYRNDHHVVDLWGLASKEALELRLASADSGWIERLTDAHDAKLAMIYAPWFGELPASWVELGSLRIGRKLVSAARTVVTFYAVDEESARAAKGLLAEFEETLPRGVRFDPPGAGGDL